MLLLKQLFFRIYRDGGGSKAFSLTSIAFVMRREFNAILFFFSPFPVVYNSGPSVSGPR